MQHTYVRYHGRATAEPRRFTGSALDWTGSEVTPPGAHGDPKYSLIAARKVVAWWNGRTSVAHYVVTTDFR
jgi:hypothetical protein